MNLKVGDKIIVEIEKNIFGGEGLSRFENKVIFVPMSIEGEKLEIEIISTKKDYARGLITKIIEPSPYRVGMPKISFEDFNACDYGMMTYNKQLETKEKIFLDEMKRHNISDFDFEKIIFSEKNTEYRNKVAEPFSIKDGKIITGFFKRKSHNIFETTEDNLKSKNAKIITKYLLDELNTYNKNNRISVFSDIKNKGSLKQLIIRNNEKNEIMIVIVIYKNKEYSKIYEFLMNFIEKYEKIFQQKYKIVVKSMYISIKNKLDNYILGEEDILVYGNHYIEEEIEGIKFKIYPKSFFQINIEQTKKMYNKIKEYLNKEESKKIIDAYSGTGTIAMMVSKYADKVIAIENSKDSVISGMKTIEENNIKNIEYVLGKVEDKIFNLKPNEVDTIIFDPPRKGIDRVVVENIKNVKNIIYVSCNLSTFVRDLSLFIKNGYKLKKVSLIDMFPQTHHIEIVSLIERMEVL